MKKLYSEALLTLVKRVDESRDTALANHERYESEVKYLLSLGDASFEAYSSMVRTNELHAAKAIEKIAVRLLVQNASSAFSLYPVAPKYQNLSPEVQEQSRPFQLVLTEENLTKGVVFCGRSETGEYYKKFIDGAYAVDTLMLVMLMVPNGNARQDLFESVNDFNKSAGIPIERIPILDFWNKYLGPEECADLLQFAAEFNASAHDTIGFSTVAVPTEKALRKFKLETGSFLANFDYKSVIPDYIYPNQIDIMVHNYLERRLWRVMTGSATFASSFITSEWFYKMYQMTENLDLTNVVTGYLKSIEQLLFSILLLSQNQGVTIKSKVYGLTTLDSDNLEEIDSTLGSLEKAIDHNQQLLDVNWHVKRFLVTTVKEWRENQRNGYFHKHNLHSTKIVSEIRDKAIIMYFLMLGSCKIRDDQLVSLGIDA